MELDWVVMMWENVSLVARVNIRDRFAIERDLSHQYLQWQNNNLNWHMKFIIFSCLRYNKKTREEIRTWMKHHAKSVPAGDYEFYSKYKQLPDSKIFMDKVMYNMMVNRLNRV